MFEPVKQRITDLLRASEPYMKTDMVYLASSGFWLTLGQVVSLAAGFALSIAFGNLVSKEVFGTYKFVFSLAGLLGTIALTAMGTAVTQAVARGFEGALDHSFRSYLWWSIPSVALTLGASLYYYVQGNMVLSLSLIVVAGLAPFVSAFNLYSSFLQGKKDFRRTTIYGFALSVVPPLLLIGVMFTDARDHVWAYIGGYYISMVIISAFFHYRTMRVYKPAATKDPAMVKNAVHLSFMNVLGRVASYVDKILVFHFLGAAQLAVYSFASAPPQYALKVNGVFRTLALPKLAERDIPTLKRTLPRKILLHFIVALIATALYILFVPYFFYYLYPQYLDSIPYAQVLGLTMLSAPGVWLGQTLIAHMKKRELYFVNTLMPIIKMTLFVTLIPLYGIWGVVTATILTGAIGFVVGVWVFRNLK